MIAQPFQKLIRIYLAIIFSLWISTVLFAEEPQTVKVETHSQTQTTRQSSQNAWEDPQAGTAAQPLFGDWDPYQEFDHMKASMNKIMEQTMQRAHQAMSQLEGGFASPRMDVREGKDRYVVSLDAPGMDKDKLQIDASQDTLTISGERKIESTSQDAQGNVIQQERRTGSFKRTLPMPANVDTDKITAKYDLGVLTVELPKKSSAPEEPAKKIPVQ